MQHITRADVDRDFFHELNWRAIVAGTVAMLGLESFLMLLGSAIGLSALNFFDLPMDGPFRMPLAVILFLAITILGSSFFGAWVAGHWSNVETSEDAAMHGALTWALGAVLIGAGIFSIFQSPGPAMAMMQQQPPMQQIRGGADAKDKAAAAANTLMFSSLDDPYFTSFLVNRAENWAEQNRQIPVSVDRKGSRVDTEARDEKSDKADKEKDKNQIKPDDVEKNNELQSFVMTQTGMGEDQAKDFLKENKTVIAKAQNATQDRWEKANAKELVQAERARKSASTMAWTLTILAFLALGASVAGSYLGWSQRNHMFTTEEDVKHRETSGFGDTMPPPI